MRKEVIIPAAYALGGFVVGGAVTYFAINARLKSKYEAQVNEDIASVKAHYHEQLEEEINKAKETYAFVKGTPEEAARILMARMDEVQASVDYKAQIEELGYGDSPLLEDIVTAPIEDAEELMSVNNEALELLREKLARGPEMEPAVTGVAFEEESSFIDSATVPFIIPVDEFFGDEEDFEKLTITYFAKDDTLVDERKTPIKDVEGTIGLRFAENFGSRSNDANIVYIRNRRLEADFEVVLDKSSFTETILGIKDEDSKKQSVKRMREDV